MTRSANEFYNEFDGEMLDEGKRSLTEQIDFQHYLRILRKHKWPIVLFTATVTALGAYYAKTATPIYEAESTLLIESQKANVVSIEELVGLDQETREYYETQYALLRSRRLAERVINHLNMWDDPELWPVAPTPEQNAESPGSESSIEVQGFADKFRSILVDLGLVETTEPDQSMTVDSKSTLDLAGPVAVAEQGSTSSDSQVSRTGSESSAFGIQMEQARRDQAPEFNMTYAGDDSEYQPRTDGELARVIIVARFMGRLKISPVRGTKLVQIGYLSADPVVSARVANAVGDQYIESYLDARMEMTSKASQWLNDRLATLKADLDESESRLIAFKQANGLVDVDGSVGRLNEQELLLATSELAQARSDLSTASDLYNEVSSLRGNRELLESIVAIQSDPLVQQVKIEQGQRRRELDELLNRYGERHPRVIDAKSRLASLDATMSGHVNRVIGSIEKNYQLLRQRVASIENKLASGKESIQNLGSKRFELQALERELSTRQNIYDTFFGRMAESTSADGLEAANARITEYAIPPLGPVKPNKQLIIALAALGSLVLSVLMAILYEQMDETVKSTADIEEKLGLKLLGILPLLKGGVLNRSIRQPLNPIDVRDRWDKKGTFVESVNTVRTAFCMDDGDVARKVITITSSAPGEGKSTASINLAYSLAQLEKVLIIDCDMRRPSIAKSAGLDSDIAGLSNLITNTAVARDCIRRGVFGGVVDILPSGPTPAQPLELLSSRRFEKILEQLKRHYDRIIIDSAPTQAVSDALVLSRLSDAMVYVIKSHDTSFDLVKHGIQRLNQVNAPLAGAVITQVDIDKLSSYGGDYFYQGYYDYYGYNNKDQRMDADSRIRLTSEEILHLKTDDSDVDLDLDYGLERSSGRAPGWEQESDNEFDLTAQIDRDVSSYASGGATTSRERQSRSSSGNTPEELDIL